VYKKYIDVCTGTLFRSRLREFAYELSKINRDAKNKDILPIILFPIRNMLLTPSTIIRPYQREHALTGGFRLCVGVFSWRIVRGKN
jgi:hypothetical protein